MRRTLLIVIIALLSIHIMAEQRMVQLNVVDKHYGMFSISGGYFSLMENFDDLSTVGGFTTALSGGYQFNYNGLWVSIAGEMQYWQSMAFTKPYTYDLQMYDTQGKQFTYHFDLDKSHETSYGIAGYIPLLIGYTIDGFYIGAGAKVGYTFWAKSHTSRNYRTYATYPQYFEDFTEMPNHYYTEYSATASEKLKTKISVNILGEIGYDVLYHYSLRNLKRDKVLRVAAYVEYGLLNIISTPSDNPLFQTNTIHPTQLDIFPYYNRKATTSNKVIPFSAGIKLTYMIRIPTRNCNCD